MIVMVRAIHYAGSRCSDRVAGRKWGLRSKVDALVGMMASETRRPTGRGAGIVRRFKCTPLEAHCARCRAAEDTLAELPAAA